MQDEAKRCSNASVAPVWNLRSLRDEMHKAGGYDVEENLTRTERLEITVFPAGRKNADALSHNLSGIRMRFDSVRFNSVILNPFMPQMT
jgi:hypothetical protein